MDAEDDRFFWEEHAQDAITRLVESAKFDEIRGVVSVPTHNPVKHDFGTESSNLEELTDYLREVYNEVWYSYVPFDRGTAVFEDDAWGAVDNLLIDNPNIDEFFERNAPPSDSETIVSADDLLRDADASRIVRVSFEEINDELIRYLAANPSKMREMAPRKFEELVADMFRNQGYEVTLTPRSNDGGMDVIAVQRSDVGTVMTLIECKRYAKDNKVGVDIVRGLYGVVEQKRASRGIIVKTSSFTRGAKAFHDDLKYRLGLADFDTLTRQIREWKNQIER